MTEADVQVSLAATRLATIQAIARLANARDDDSGLHLDRISAFSRLLAERLAQLGDPEASAPGFVQAVAEASPLHDIGKLGVPERILRKPGKLDAYETSVMRAHTNVGFRVLESVAKSFPGDPFLEMAGVICRYHHERWNGMGYPDGLARERIPLAARITALVDVYDAIRAHRPFKLSQSHERAMQLIEEERGVFFDPNLVALFLEMGPEIEVAWERLSGK